jgi:hypothetical protein
LKEQCLARFCAKDNIHHEREVVHFYCCIHVALVADSAYKTKDENVAEDKELRPVDEFSAFCSLSLFIRVLHYQQEVHLRLQYLKDVPHVQECLRKDEPSLLLRPHDHSWFIDERHREHVEQY